MCVCGPLETSIGPACTVAGVGQKIFHSVYMSVVCVCMRGSMDGWLGGVCDASSEGTGKLICSLGRSFLMYDS